MTVIFHTLNRVVRSQSKGPQLTGAGAGAGAEHFYLVTAKSQRLLDPRKSGTYTMQMRW